MHKYRRWSWGSIISGEKFNHFCFSYVVKMDNMLPNDKSYTMHVLHAHRLSTQELVSQFWFHALVNFILFQPSSIEF